jgi:hypothetical protein
MKDVYIHHHLGMGDHITCNALVRNIAKKYDKVYLFYKSLPWHLPNLKYMYRDMGDKIDFIGGMDWHDEFVDFYRWTHPGINYMRIGFEYLNTTANSTLGKKNFDELFYQQVGIPFQKKFDDFYIQRDDEIEDQVCKELNPTGEPYAFIHQDKERGLYMNLDYIKDKKLKIIEPAKKYLFAHHAKLIEQATEVHVMESTFKCYIDCFIAEKENMFFHRYMRNAYAIGRNYWTTIGTGFKQE